MGTLDTIFDVYSHQQLVKYYETWIVVISRLISPFVPLGIYWK